MNSVDNLLESMDERGTVDSSVCVGKFKNKKGEEVELILTATKDDYDFIDNDLHVSIIES